jgi:hypothetical protein
MPIHRHHRHHDCHRDEALADLRASIKLKMLGRVPRLNVLDAPLPDALAGGDGADAAVPGGPPGVIHLPQSRRLPARPDAQPLGQSLDDEIPF